MRGRIRSITGIALIVAILLVGAAALAWSRRARVSTGPQVGTGIGELAPAFSVTTLGGSTLSSDALRGRPIVLTSAAAWCPTCALEAEQLSAAYKAIESSSVVFLTVDIDPQDAPATIESFRSREDTPWPYADARSAASLIHDYGLNRFEITYVIDGSGIVRFRDSTITSTAVLRDVLAGVQ